MDQFSSLVFSINFVIFFFLYYQVLQRTHFHLCFVWMILDVQLFCVMMVGFSGVFALFMWVYGLVFLFFYFLFIYFLA